MYLLNIMVGPPTIPYKAVYIVMNEIYKKYKIKMLHLHFIFFHDSQVGFLEIFSFP